jgi:hypothetical protein
MSHDDTYPAACPRPRASSAPPHSHRRHLPAMSVDPTLSPPPHSNPCPLTARVPHTSSATALILERCP